jgi:pSer/pThr/pTyr-binding forkhead associated (FHA) protein
MAAKLILSMEGVVLHEYALSKDRMTIGRKSHNDVVIDNLAVSGEHAAVVTILNDSFLEDLNSTNGVMVNGIAIKKHFLLANDVIEIGKYKLKYINDQQGQQATPADFERTMVLRSPVNKSQTVVAPAPAPAPEPVVTAALKPAEPATMQQDATGKFTSLPVQVNSPVPPPPVQTASTVPPAALQILSGPNAGRELDLVKNLTTLGKPGLQVAVLTRRPHGYFITHVEGVNYPSLNGKSLSDQPQQLNNHDIIELAGIKMEFYLKD